MRVTCSADAHFRDGLTWRQRWDGPDDGLVACWEAGRLLAMQQPWLADRTLRGQLPILPWKGGLAEPLTSGHKFGSLYYLAMWHGLRGEALDIDTAAEVTLACSATATRVTFTANRARWDTAS